MTLGASNEVDAVRLMSKSVWTIRAIMVTEAALMTVHLTEICPAGIKQAGPLPQVSATIMVGRRMPFTAL
jgi:hypothetical protein